MTKKLKPQAVRLEGETVEELKDLDIQTQGIKVKSYDDKINHLIWFYKSYKNNNSK